MNLNIYRYRFWVPCPNNGRAISYTLKLETGRTIMVEDIIAAGEHALTLEKPYHENIADMLYERFGGEQGLRAFHHGVEIETRRG